MKNNISKIFLTLLLLISTLFGITIKSGKVFASEIKVTNQASEIVMEVNSKRVLYQNNAYDRKYMASTTKILTAICVIENCDVNDVVEIPEEATNIEGSSIYLKAGEKLTVKELLFGLMLRSGNDSATALALHTSGTIKDFAELMNQTAKRIGAQDSNFVNPHGLHDDKHYTTAYDLGLISCYAMKNDTFREIVGAKSVKISNEFYDYPRVLINKNKMLSLFEGSNGIKTGYTKKAGRCLVSSCIRNDMELVCVVLSCPPMWERSMTLLSNCFNDYSYQKVLESDNIIDFNENPPVKTITHAKKDVYLPLTKHEFETLRYEIEYFDNLNRALTKDTPIGKIKFYTENNLIFEEKIYTII